MKTKDDELKRHMEALKSFNPEVGQEVWDDVAWRMKCMWSDGAIEGINRMANNYIAAKQAEREQVEQRYADRAKVKL